MLQKIWPIILLIVIAVVIYGSGFTGYLDFETLREKKSSLNNFIDQNMLIAVLIFTASYICIAALSLPFASFMTIASGFLFGTIIGTIATVTGATIGATILFLIAKSSFGAILRKKANTLYNKIKEEMNENAVSYLLFLRLVPLFPFFLVNIMPAFFDITLRTYIWTTALGILPGTLIYVNVGRSLETVDNPADLVSGRILIALGLLGCVALLPAIYRRWKRASHA